MVAIFEMLDKVELPVPENVALEDAPLPDRAVMLVVPEPLTVSAFEFPMLSDEKERAPVVFVLETDKDFPVPIKFTPAAKELFADPCRAMDEDAPPSRFRV
jgi:hypothetical protein